MNCLECQELLQQRLDGEAIAAAEALEQHLNQCATCREQHTAAARLLEGLKELPRTSPASGFARAIGAQVMQDRRQRRDKLRRRVLVTTALAASVLAILLLSTFWLPRSPQDGMSLVLDRPKIVVPPIKEKIPDEIVPEPRSPLSPLMDRWADATRDHAKVVLLAANLNAMENLPVVDNLPPIDPGVREASQEVSDGVRTVTRNARRALNFFAREIPMPELVEQKN